MLPQAEPFCSGANVRFATLLRRFCYLKGIGVNGSGLDNTSYAITDPKAYVASGKAEAKYTLPWRTA
jgi:hypothetical protein